MRVQRAKCLCGVVVYSNGDPVGGAKIEELGERWKGSLRSIHADSKASFVLEPVKGRKIYYLQIIAPTPGINRLRAPVKIVRFKGTKSRRSMVRDGETADRFDASTGGEVSGTR